MTDPSEEIRTIPDRDVEEARVIELTVGSGALAKSCMDPFDYALGLRTGTVIYYRFAKVINTEWIHLDVHIQTEQPDQNRLPYRAERGIDVRISDIVWVMDAPNGS